MKLLFVIPLLMAASSYAQQGLVRRRRENMFVAAMTRGQGGQDEASAATTTLEQDSHCPAWHHGAAALREVWERVLMERPDSQDDLPMSMGQQHHDRRLKASTDVMSMPTGDRRLKASTDVMSMPMGYHHHERQLNDSTDFVSMSIGYQHHERHLTDAAAMNLVSENESDVPRRRNYQQQQRLLVVADAPVVGPEQRAQNHADAFGRSH